MSSPASDGIHLNKEYYKNFSPTDLQWTVDKVDDDFTLYDLFHLVYHAEQLIPGIAATFGMPEFHLFWDQINLDREPDDIDDVNYLELYWWITYDTRVEKKTGKSTDQPTTKIRKELDMDDGNNYLDDPKLGELPNLMSFHGIGSGCPSKGLDFHECDDNCPKDSGYAIEFTQVNNLAHLPIRISPKIYCYPPFVESDRQFNRTGFELKIEPTLWCFITSIFWELTFMGYTPDEIANKRQKISNCVDEINKHLKNEKNSDRSTKD